MSENTTWELNRPVAFAGTEDEKRANRYSHNFINYGDESECADCFCKPWHTAADYPCGQEPPRETSVYEYDADGKLIGVTVILDDEGIAALTADYNDAEREDH